jgi:hypothetical protein
MPSTQITKLALSIGGGTPPRTPCITKSGITITENRQPYFWTDLIQERPVLPLMDGPRGFCTTPFTTAVNLGRQGKTYAAGPQQVFVLDATGAKRTLFGFSHKYQPYWMEAAADGPEIEVIGQWKWADGTPVAAAECNALQPWYLVWVQSTLAVDPNAPIPPGEVDHPHAGAGPVMWVPDFRGNLVKAQFSATAHDSSTTVCTKYPGFSQPWGADSDGGNVLFVAERTAHRIAMVDATTGARLGTLLENTNGDSFGSFDGQLTGQMKAGVTLAQCRAQDIIAPEGLRYFNGYVYFGSLAQQDIRRFPVTKQSDGTYVKSGAVEIVCRPYIDDNSHYLYFDIAKKDGFNVAGTIAATTWSVGNNGRPEVFVPGVNTASDGTKLTHAKWKWQDTGGANNVLQGPGGKWDSSGYGSACALGGYGAGTADDPYYGALIGTSSDGDISLYVQYDAALDGPLPTAADYAAMDRGGDVYRRDYLVLHGQWCAGPDIPLPWDANADCDAFMQRGCGMARS